MDPERIKLMERAGKENENLVNRMRNYQDPLLAAFDEELDTKTSASSAAGKKKSDNDDSDGSNDSSGSESSEEALDINFPRDNAADLLQFIHRDITNLSNMEDDKKRKFALIRLYQIFVLSKTKAPNRLYQELLPEIQK